MPGVVVAGSVGSRKRRSGKKTRTGSRGMTIMTAPRARAIEASRSGLALGSTTSLAAQWIGELYYDGRRQARESAPVVGPRGGPTYRNRHDLDPELRPVRVRPPVALSGRDPGRLALGPAREWPGLGPGGGPGRAGGRVRRRRLRLRPA